MIKVRVWDEEVKHYVRHTPNNRMMFKENGVTTTIIEGMNIYQFVERYTELHDKKGKEIYECDCFVDIDNSLVGYVVFDNGGFGVEWHTVDEYLEIDPESSFTEYFHEVYSVEMEVVGTTHTIVNQIKEGDLYARFCQSGI